MALLNELLEDATARCHTLSQEAQQATAAVDQLVEQAEHLEAQVEAAAQDVRHRIHELSEELSEAEKSVGHGAEDAEHRLQGLVSRAAELRGRLGELVEAAGHATEQLHGRAQHVGDRLHQEAEAASHGSETALSELSHLQEATAAGFGKAAAALSAFTEAVSHAREQWDEKQTAFLAALEAMDHAVRDKVQACVDEVADLLDHQRIEVLVEGLANETVVTPHNQAVDLLGRHFEEEAPGHAQQAVAPLRAALEQLVQGCDSHTHDLGERSAEIASHARSALQEAEAMRPALDDAARLS